MSFLAYSTPWDCIVDFHKTPHGFTLAFIYVNEILHFRNFLGGADGSRTRVQK